MTRLWGWFLARLGRAAYKAAWNTPKRELRYCCGDYYDYPDRAERDRLNWVDVGRAVVKEVFGR